MRLLCDLTTEIHKCKLLPLLIYRDYFEVSNLKAFLKCSQEPEVTAAYLKLYKFPTCQKKLSLPAWSICVHMVVLQDDVNSEESVNQLRFSHEAGG